MFADKVTMAGLFKPCEKRRAILYELILIVGGSLVVGLSAQVSFWLPFSPVPVTGQTFAVLIIALLLGSRGAALAMILYLIEGVCGLPVFASARTGPQILLGPTGGYIIGFIAAGYVTGLLAEKKWDRRIITTICAMVVGNCIIYTFGIFWLGCLMGFGRTVLVVGLYPFLVGDVFKITLAALILPAGWKLLALLHSHAGNST